MIEPLYRIVSYRFSPILVTVRVFLLGGVRGEVDADPVVFCLAVLVCSPHPQPTVPLPHTKAQGLMGSKGSQPMAEIGGGTLETPTLLSLSLPPSCCLSLALMGVCLAVLLICI